MGRVHRFKIDDEYTDVTGFTMRKDTRVFTMSMKSDETRGEYIKIMEISYVKRPDQGVKE